MLHQPHERLKISFMSSVFSRKVIFSAHSPVLLCVEFPKWVTRYSMWSWSFGNLHKLCLVFLRLDTNTFNWLTWINQFHRVVPDGSSFQGTFTKWTLFSSTTFGNDRDREFFRQTHKQQLFGHNHLFLWWYTQQDQGNGAGFGSSFSVLGFCFLLLVLTFEFTFYSAN